MYKKKRMEKKYNVIILLVLLFFILGLITFFVRDHRTLSLPEKAIKDSALFIEKIVLTPIRIIQDKVDEIHEKNKLFKKYSKYRDAYEKAEALEARYQEAKKEIEELQATLELNHSLSDYLYLNATVINRNIDDWYQTITLDKGSKNGVEEGMAVIIRQGLIGQVIQTTNFNCTVKLLTSSDANNKISVKILKEQGDIYGLLTGFRESKNLYTLEGIASNTEIKEGDQVVTTGLGNAFPSGILIGSVSSITKDHFDLARTVLVTPSVSFDHIRYVTILKRKIAS